MTVNDTYLNSNINKYGVKNKATHLQAGFFNFNAL